MSGPKQRKPSAIAAPRPTPSATAARRKRRGLSREKLTVAALHLLDEKGSGALSMRSLAEAAGVTPMALYNHFGGRADMLAAVADHVVGAADFDGRHEDWRDQIRHCFGTLRSLCLRHPGLPALLEQEGAAPASVFAPMEVTLRALRAAGLDDLDGTRAYFLLVGFTLAQAAYQTRAPVAGLDPSGCSHAARSAGRGYTVTERLDLPPKWDFDASFAYGLSLIVRGIEASVSR